MKVAVSGKGGVGKTTVSAHLARCWRDLSHRVVAVDADPDANLAGTLGYRGPEIAPLASWKTLVEERVGGGDGWGGFLRMNPRVDDIPARVGVDIDGIRVLVMGTIERGRRGCACPENVLAREVVKHLLLRHDEHVVVDMEAGIEHLARGTAEGVDFMLIVVEPGWASLETAARIAGLARDLGIARVGVAANRVATSEDEEFVRRSLGDVPLAAVLPLDPAVERDARSGKWPRSGAFYEAMRTLAERLDGGLAIPQGSGLRTAAGAWTND
jgi:CO dehydrogenase maturation factor